MSGVGVSAQMALGGCVIDDDVMCIVMVYVEPTFPSVR